MSEVGDTPRPAPNADRNESEVQNSHDRQSRPNRSPQGAVSASASIPLSVSRPKQEVEGNFQAGALVSVRDSQGEYARGLVNYSAEDLRRIAGLHSSKIARVLGRADFTEAIHRDNLSLLD